MLIRAQVSTRRGHRAKYIVTSLQRSFVFHFERIDSPRKSCFFIKRLHLWCPLWVKVEMLMGVAYMGRCAITQGIHGKRDFDFMSYGSRVIGQNIKWPHGGAITGLSGRFGAEVHHWHPRSVSAQFRSLRTSGTGD